MTLSAITIILLSTIQSTTITDWVKEHPKYPLAVAVINPFYAKEIFYNKDGKSIELKNNKRFAPYLKADEIYSYIQNMTQECPISVVADEYADQQIVRRFLSSIPGKTGTFPAQKLPDDVRSALHRLFIHIELNHVHEIFKTYRGLSRMKDKRIYFKKVDNQRTKTKYSIEMIHPSMRTDGFVFAADPEIVSSPGSRSYVDLSSALDKQGSFIWPEDFEPISKDNTFEIPTLGSTVEILNKSPFSAGGEKSEEIRVHSSIKDKPFFAHLAGSVTRSESVNLICTTLGYEYAKDKFGYSIFPKRPKKYKDLNDYQANILRLVPKELIRYLEFGKEELRNNNDFQKKNEYNSNVWKSAENLRIACMVRIHNYVEQGLKSKESVRLIDLPSEVSDLVFLTFATELTSNLLTNSFATKKIPIFITDFENSTVSMTLTQNERSFDLRLGVSHPLPDGKSAGGGMKVGNIPNVRE
jgi:hypothetical protein